MSSKPLKNTIEVKNVSIGYNKKKHSQINGKEFVIDIDIDDYKYKPCKCYKEICNECKLHPYTISESNSTYNTIINKQLNHVDMIGKDSGKYAYDGILCSLLSERARVKCVVCV